MSKGHFSPPTGFGGGRAIHILDLDQRPYPNIDLLEGAVRDHFLQKNMRLQHIRRFHRLEGLFACADGSGGGGGMRFAYHPAPKNASTSIKFLLAQMAGLSDKYADYDDIPIHQQRRLGCEHVQFSHEGRHRTVVAGFPLLPIHNFVATWKFIPKGGCRIRFCVIRDPVRRCVSMYHNRISFHRETPFISFDEFIARLDEFKEPNSDFAPQSYFLGTDPGYYTHIFPMRDISGIEALLSEIAGAPIHLPSMQRNKRSGDRFSLTRAQRLSIEQAYARDYKIFGNYL